MSNKGKFGSTHEKQTNWKKKHPSKALFENCYFRFTNFIPFLICVQFCPASRGWFYSIFNIHPIWPASRGGSVIISNFNELGLSYLFPSRGLCLLILECCVLFISTVAYLTKIVSLVSLWFCCLDQTGLAARGCEIN